MSETRSGEFAWIAHLSKLAGEGAFGFQDDAALLDVSGDANLVVTQDTVVEGVHFLREDWPHLAGKVVGVNVSDVVAKGARPFAMLLSLALPDWWADSHVVHFTERLAQTAKHYGIALMGGDTTRSPGPLVATVTMLGRPIDGYASRLGAKVGDVIAVTGPIGDAALALALRTGRFEERAGMTASDAASKAGLDLQRFDIRRVLPAPWPFAADLVARHANAAMDVSDGFVGDLRKICIASAKKAAVSFGEVPLSQSAANLMNAVGPEGELAILDMALTGGDDYVVLMTLPEDRFELAKAEADEAAGQSFFGLYRVGRIVGDLRLDGTEQPVVSETGEMPRFAKESWEH